MKRAFVGAAVFALAACAAPLSRDPTPLAGTHWTAVGGDAPSITFDADRAHGATGCNRWFASYTANGEALRFGNAGVTRMACLDPERMERERAFLDAIHRTEIARVEDGQLVLREQAGGELARFDPAP